MMTIRERLTYLNDKDGNTLLKGIEKSYRRDETIIYYRKEKEKEVNEFLKVYRKELNNILEEKLD